MNRRFVKSVARLGFTIAALYAVPSAFGQSFSIDPITLPDALLGTTYPAVALTTSNGIGQVSWQFVGTTLPPSGFVVGPANTGTTGTFCWGNTLSSFTPKCTGNVQGFLPGTYQFTIRARDGGLQTFDRVVTLHVLQSVQISTTTLPDVAVNGAYAQQLQVTGGSGNYQWSLVSGALPSGITLDANSGILSGSAPSIGGDFTFTIGVKDLGTQVTANRQFTLHVSSALAISSADPPFFTVGQQITPYQFVAVGGTSYTWSVAPGSNLPQNFVLSTDGVLSGAGTTVGTFSVILRVTDTTQSASAQKAFTLTVNNGTLRIIETSLPKAAANTAYSATLTAAGGIPPYTWSFATLDTHGFGMVAATGTIFGTPTAFGQVQLPVNLVDSVGTRATQTYTLTVLPQLILTTTSLPNAAVGTAYSASLSAQGGETPYSWSITSGQLPAGLILNSDAGRIEGTPLNSNGASFTLKVTDNGGRTDSKALTMVVGAGVTITTGSLPDAVVGKGYSFGMQATGGALPLQWTIVNGSLPAGIAIDAVTGVITGTASTPGAFSLTIRVKDAANNTNDKVLTLNVVGVLTITTTSLSPGLKSSAYSQTLAVSGGRSPYSWSLTSGNLPAGLSIDTSSGAITGTPTGSGSSTFTIGVTDAGAQTTSASFTIQISDPISITSGDLSGVAGQAFSQTLSVQGGTAPYTWSVTSGALPDGLTLNSSTGQITGTPTAAGPFSVTIQAKDQGQVTASKAINITITFPSVPAITLTLPTNPQPGQQPSFNLSLASAFPGIISGTIDLTFASAVGGDDSSVQFISPASRSRSFAFGSGSTTVQYLNLPPVPGGSTPAPLIMTGTVAGTVTLTMHDVVAKSTTTTYSISVPAGNQTQSFTIPRVAPVITSVVLQRLTNSVNVVVTGYSTTREISSGAFHFTATSGNSVAQSDVTVPLTSSFATWFANPASNATGGQFVLTVPFSVQGNTSAVSSVGVTLTNGQGVSTSTTAQ